MKVLVVGATGAVGGAVAQALAARGHEVVRVGGVIAGLEPALCAPTQKARLRHGGGPFVLLEGRSLSLWVRPPSSELIALGGDAVEGPWDGEEAITLLPDLDAGATGAMTGGAYPDGIRPIIEAHRHGDRELALTLYQRWLPLINFENRQAGLLAAKALMKEGGVIACEAPRHPWPPMHPDTRAGLIETARHLDPLVLRWAA